ncbi:MAG: hypothetical protein IKD74_03520 [Clostridia bacterium]|nr:hypothetical protein [Clostridia bacterium]
MKKGIIIVLAIILVMIISTICIININNSKNEKIYSQENEQFDILFKEYSKIIAGEILGDVTIVMDESTYTNFVTGEKYTQEHIDRIKEFEITGSPNSKLLILKVTNYNDKDKSVIISCTEDEHVHQTLVKFGVSDGKLVKKN